uniref:Uncharacterized protein n=1 Tax=Anopheles culicifacies TaxID=139723 RepID=A0A182MMN9_9DIPT
MEFALELAIKFGQLSSSSSHRLDSTLSFERMIVSWKQKSIHWHHQSIGDHRISLRDTLSTNTSSPLDGTVPDSETVHLPCQVENDHDKHSVTQQLNHNNDSIPPSVNAQQAVSSPTLTTAASSFMGVHFGANEHLQQQHNNIHHQHHQQPHRGGVGGGPRATATEAVVVQPTASGPAPTSLPTANGAHSHSNAGSEHSGSSAAIATATNRTGSGNSSVIVERESTSTVCNSAVAVSSNSTSYNSNGKLTVSGVNGQAQQQPNSRDGVAARKMVAATAAEEIVVVYENNTVLGGGLDATGGGVVGGGGIGAIGDAGEELKYGPGIVSRLRCRYLSLALRQSVTKQRPSLNSMRRATSLNNLLDEESEDLIEALVRYDHKAWERDGANPVAPAIAAAPAPAALAVPSSAEVGSNVIILDEIAQATTTTTGAATATTAATVPAGTEVHGATNGISSSVSPTAMLMNGKGTAGGAGSASELPLLVSDCVTIEEKIINGREKGDPKPKRLTSIIDADERPPPDVVKQTMKIFEANANRRGGRGVPGTNNNAGNEVASKVASYRSIIISGSATAGATTAAAAVSSAVGPGDKPPITHPKPPLSPKKPNIMPRTASPKQQHQATAAKPPPTPKSLEAVNNLKNAPGGTTVKNNNKPPPMVGGGGTIESTPPSPPARSKHMAAAAALNGGNGVGVVLAKNMQSMNGSNNSGEGGNATGTTQLDPTDAKTNALKNGSTVRDHHNYENGTTQTTPLSKTSSSTTLPPGSDVGGHQHKHTGNIAQEATAAAVLASSSPSGICDSPSIQQLTSKLGSIHLATSTPTGAANGSVSSVHDRRNLEYVTSDEEEEDDDDDDDDVDGERRNTTSYTVNPDSSESEDARDIPGAAGSENDADDDEAEEEEEDDTDGGQRSVRKISRTAMENIARAGTTTQFRFNGAVKSYLPGSGGGGGSGVAAPSTKPPAPPIPKSRESLTGKANGASSAVPIEVNGRLPPEGASVTSPNSVINSGGNNSNNSSSAVVGSSAVQVVACGVSAESGGSATSVVPSLTRREIEKNQINREKSGEPAGGPASSGTNSINGTGTAPANAGPGTTTGSGVLVASANNPNNGGASGVAKQQTTASNSISAVSSSVDSTTSFVAKWGTGGGGAGVTVAAAGQSPLAGLVPARKKVKPPPNHQQDGTNTMVFNFSDRKDVPDYIENDGVIIRPRPRELPKLSPLNSGTGCTLRNHHHNFAALTASQSFSMDG